MSQLFRLVFCAVALCLAPLPRVHAAEEAALLELWEKHLATPDDHDGMVKACRAFAAAHPGDPLIPVTHGLEAWHWLRAGRKEDAVKLLEPYLAAQPSPVNDAGKRLALGWLTRLDRDRVAASLQVYYRKEIAFPKSLDQFATNPKIPTDARPLMMDRFGKPWVYGLVGFAKVPGLQDQKYSLQSSTLGDLSDLKITLALPYASRFPATPVQVLAVSGGAPTVKFNFTGNPRPVILSPGTASGNLQLAYVGEKIIVASDYTFWKIFPRP